jgi:hypothetical protein
MLLSLLECRQEKFEIFGLDIEKANNDLFAADLAEGVQDLANGVSCSYQEL